MRREIRKYLKDMLIIAIESGDYNYEEEGIYKTHDMLCNILRDYEDLEEVCVVQQKDFDQLDCKYTSKLLKEACNEIKKGVRI